MQSDTGKKCNVKSECDVMLEIVGGEDATAIVFKIQPFVRFISYCRLCHASSKDFKLL